MVSLVVSGVVEVVERKPSNRYKLPPEVDRDWVHI